MLGSYLKQRISIRSARPSQPYFSTSTLSKASSVMPCRGSLDVNSGAVTFATETNSSIIATLQLAADNSSLASGCQFTVTISRYDDLRTPSRRYHLCHESPRHGDGHRSAHDGCRHSA